MKFSCNNTLLKQVVTLFGSIIPTRWSHSAQNAILIEGSKSQNLITFTAFNFVDGLCIKFAPQTIEEDFKILCPGLFIYRLISNITQLGDAAIEFEVNDNTLFVHSDAGRVSVTLMTLEVFEFSMLKPKDGQCLEVSIDSLQMAINRTIACTATKGQTVLDGINFNSDNFSLTLSSTNGHTLSMATIPVSNNVSISATVSKSFLSLLDKLARLFKLSQEETSICFKENQVFINLNFPTQWGVIELTLLGRLLEGVFPPVKKIIPESFDYVFQIPKTDLLSVLNIIDCVSSDLGADNNVNIIKIAIEERAFTIEYAPIQERQVKQSIALPYSNIENLVFALDKSYLLKHLKTLKSDAITFKLNGPHAPVVIMGNSELIEELGLIMPINLMK